MRRLVDFLTGASLCAALAACGPLSQGGPLPEGWAALTALVPSQAQSAAQAPAQARGADPRRDLTRAIIASSPVPLLLVELSERDVAASLFLAGTAAGRSSWLSRDGVGVTLRDGMLIETRGLGEDLMAADVAQIRDRLAVPGRGLRIHDYLDGTDRISRRSFDCETALVGREVIEIVGRSYLTTRIDETCFGALASFVNSYWRDADGGIRRARQWVSPSVGYLELSRLSDDTG